ncbi:MAG: hypothetical protein AB4352_19430 [Hormoscilla sp.]
MSPFSLFGGNFANPILSADRTGDRLFGQSPQLCQDLWPDYLAKDFFTTNNHTVVGSKKIPLRDRAALTAKTAKSHAR